MRHDHSETRFCDLANRNVEIQGERVVHRSASVGGTDREIVFLQGCDSAGSGCGVLDAKGNYEWSRCPHVPDKRDIG